MAWAEAVAVPDRQAGEALPMERTRAVPERDVGAEDVGSTWAGVSGTGGDA